jgi:methylmalonyl-CoA/ethylmalonyl-CoA epimerase
MMNKVEHIGIAVNELAVAEKTFEALLGTMPYKRESVESEGVNTSFFQTGPNKIELLEATNQDSPIAKFLQKKGEGIHHIAFDVSDIELSMRQLQEAGFTLLNDKPKRGADNKWVCFVHPKESHGTLIELCQEIK